MESKVSESIFKSKTEMACNCNTTGTYQAGKYSNWSGQEKCLHGLSGENDCMGKCMLQTTCYSKSLVTR